MKLALFDFDGTLTKQDSLWSYLRFYSGTSLFVLKFLILLPILSLHICGFVSAERTKRVVLALFLKGLSRNELEISGRHFCELRLPAILRPERVNMVYDHIKAGDEVCIVTASCSFWIQPFCDKLGVQLIATELDYENSVFLGNFNTPNCKGEEKVRRIRSRYDLNKFSEIVAYGNSSADIPMMQLAHKRILV